MEKTKKEIENYINSNFDRIIAMKKSSIKLHDTKLWSDELSKFIEKLDKNLKAIISKNGVKDNESIKILSNYSIECYNKKTKELNQG